MEMKNQAENNIVSSKMKPLYDPSWFTTEEYDLKVLFILKNILEDMQEDLLDNDIDTRISRRLKCISSTIHDPNGNLKLNVGKGSNVILSHYVKYGFLRPEQIGRIFPQASVSVSRYPRDLRYFLFNNLGYQDYDLKNCHPTILYEFALNHDTLISYPVLAECVDDTAGFREKVAKEFNTNVADAKKRTLIAFYSNDNEYRSRSLTLSMLHKEIVRLRSIIKEHMIDNAKLFSINGQESQGSRYQSYYCMTVESKKLLALKDHLITDLGEYTSFIPFFDGAYVKYDNVSNEKLASSVASFNENTSDLLVFERKPIELPKDPVVSQETFDAYSNLYDALSGLGSLRFNRLLDHLNLDRFSLDHKYLSNLSSRRDHMLKIKKEKSNENDCADEFEIPEHDYNKIANEIKSFLRKFRKRFIELSEGGKLEAMNSILSKIVEIEKDDETGGYD